MVVDPKASLDGALTSYECAADHFWSFMEDRSVRFLPYQYAPMFFSTLGQLVAGTGDPAGRRAGLAVLGRMYRRFGLFPYHGTVVAAAMVDTVRRFAGDSWGPELAGSWERGCRRMIGVAERAASILGDGPHATVGEVVTRDAAADGVAILTVRPMHRLRYAPGQAVAVCTPRLPGQWRWYSPANAPRPDGTVELHVRAVPGGTVSPALVHGVQPGEWLWLGPAAEVGLSIEAAGDTDLLLAAGGTGLAPLRALTEQVAASPRGRRVTLVVGARTLSDLYDAVELDKLQQAHLDWLTVVLAFSHDTDVELDAQGDLLSVALAHHQEGQAFYVCGPPKLMQQARIRLPSAGVDPGRLHLAATFHRADDAMPWTADQEAGRTDGPRPAVDPADGNSPTAFPRDPA